MQPRFLRIVAVTVAAPALTCLVACSHLTAGSPTYAPETPSNNYRFVKTTALLTLVPEAAELDPIMKTQLATSAVFNIADSVAKDQVSDPKCVGALLAGAEPMYRGSGYGAVNGLVLNDSEGRTVYEAAAAFGDTNAAYQFVETRTAQWKGCIDKTLTMTLPDGRSGRWVASGPNTSQGVRVLLRTQEGGGGFGCSHAMAARSNIVADVLVCGPDEAVLNEQGATIATMILAKIPQK